MNKPLISTLTLPLVFLSGAFFYRTETASNVPGDDFVPDIPQTWDSTAVNAFMLPLADPNIRLQPISKDYYYGLPERVIYKSYPVYLPAYMPEGYLDSLRQLEPEILFNPDDLKTKEDWIRAGEAVFDFPHNTRPLPPGFEQLFSRMASAPRETEAGMPKLPDGVMPFIRFVVTDRGLEFGSFACGTCHTRVQQDGTLLKGVQGNNPFDRQAAVSITSQRGSNPAFNEERATASIRGSVSRLFKAPWISHDSQRWLDSLSLDDFVEASAAIPPGVVARHGSHLRYPTRIPDLRGIKDVRYLDATGLMRHQSIGDLMRYAAFNEDADFLTAYDGFVPVGNARADGHAGLPPPDSVGFSRFSEEQLYALALYLYSLEPLPSPHTYAAPMLERGKRVFVEQGCVTCHTPPLYTNNRLTPVDGFVPPDEHAGGYDIFDVSVETDPGLALYTRRGTGYYKVPSLRGLWYRDKLLHDGSLTSLDELLDPARLRDDFVPSGFKGAGVDARAVPGHPFGLELSSEDKAALIAFLNTL